MIEFVHKNTLQKNLVALIQQLKYIAVIEIWTVGIEKAKPVKQSSQPSSVILTDRKGGTTAQNEKREFIGQYLDEVLDEHFQKFCAK